MGFKKILVAVDDPTKDEVVFNHGLSLAVPNQSHFRLVHCLSLDIYRNLGSMMDAGVGLHPQSKVLDAGEKEHLARTQAAKSWLETLRSQAVAQGIGADFICETGDPGPLICYLATLWEAEVIVVGNSGKKGLRRLILGSVSQHVVDHSSCLTVVVPWDGSPPVEYPPGKTGG